MCHIPTAPHRRPPERRRIFSRSCCGRPGEPLNKVAGVEQHHHYQQQQHQQHCYHRFYMVLWSYVIRTMATTMSIKHMIDIDIDRSDHGSTKWDVYTILYIYMNWVIERWDVVLAVSSESFGLSPSPRLSLSNFQPVLESPSLSWALGFRLGAASSVWAKSAFTPCVPHIEA